MIAPTWETLRLFLHVLAATVWVGGQLTLAALVPVLRRHDAAVPKIAARAFDRVAWPAFGVLLLTGLWNVAGALRCAVRAHLGGCGLRRAAPGCLTTRLGR